MKFDIGAYKNSMKFIILVVISITILLFVNNKSLDIKTAEAHVTNDELEIEKLVINEVMTSNKGVYIDNEGNLYDWIELYNGSNKDVDLTGFGLSDKKNGEVRWIFPKTIMPANTYLVVYLSGEKKDGLYANFSLKEKGHDLLTLKSSNGKVIDSVETVELKNNYSMFRDSKGKWGITEDITPGYENTERGRDSYLYIERSIEESPSLVLSEFLPVNEGNIILDNKLYSYIELTNRGEDTISLKDYYLTNNEKVLYKWRFPDINLDPGNTYVVYLGEDNGPTFSLKKKNGVIALTDKNGIVEKVEYNDLDNGIAYIKEDDNWKKDSDISPGYSNDTSGKIQFMKEKDIAKDSLLISEVMPSNNKYLAHNGNEFYDWIELYNNSKEVINIGEYFLSTDSLDKVMFKLPDYSLEPGRYYVVMASGDTSLTGDYVHANFKLSMGEGLYLFKGDTLIDSLYIYGVPRGDSYGRGIEYGHYYYTSPTPNYQNEVNGIRELASKPVFNYNPGVYNNVSNLEIMMKSKGEIYYTLDGSIPNTTSLKYENPINITSTTIVKAIAIEEDKGSSEVVTNSYIVNENHLLPVMSVSLLKSDFDTIQASTYGHEIVNAHAELYEKNSSFSIDCGFKLFGGESRTLNKKSFSLKFNANYDGALHYKVFDNKEIRNFNTLVLRSGSQDQNSSMIRDEFIANMLIDYGTILAQGVKPVVLYIDGEYWGLYFIREKIDDDYIEKNYNVASGTNIVEYRYRAEEGVNTDFLNLKNYVEENDLSIEENYNYVLNYLDMDYYIDFYVMQFITNNSDLHNIRMFNNKNLDNGKIKLLMYDCDYCLKYDAKDYYIDYLQDPYTLKAQPDTTILKGLMQNEKFKKKFVERISYYIKNVWTEEHINLEFDKLYNAINSEMVRNAKRWELDFDNWYSEIKKMKMNAIARISNVPLYTKTYFSLSEEEYNVYFS